VVKNFGMELILDYPCGSYIHSQTSSKEKSRDKLDTHKKEANVAIGEEIREKWSQVN
jgi:hypothetical protein